jgi:hypothetical protein
MGTESMDMQSLLMKAEKVGFARIKGKNGLKHVDHIMRSYSIVLGRPNKNKPVDVALGDTMSVSREHAKIYYDFERAGFYLKVMGKNGVHVNGVLVGPKGGSKSERQLHSKTWLQVGSGEDGVWFLLPKKSRPQQPKRKREEEEGCGGEAKQQEREHGGEGRNVIEELDIDGTETRT